MKTGFGAFFFVQFERVEDDKPIPANALHSLDEGKILRPIMHPETIGDYPKNFSKDRSFWVPIKFVSLSDKEQQACAEICRKTR